MTTEATTRRNQICPDCKGNGYHKVSWEAEEVVQQCKTCNSQGEITQKEFDNYWNGSKVHGSPTSY